jgi:hypothetical protein
MRAMVTTREFASVAKSIALFAFWQHRRIYTSFVLGNIGERKENQAKSSKVEQSLTRKSMQSQAKSCKVRHRVCM